MRKRIMMIQKRLVAGFFERLKLDVLLLTNSRSMKKGKFSESKILEILKEQEQAASMVLVMLRFTTGRLSILE